MSLDKFLLLAVIKIIRCVCDVVGLRVRCLKGKRLELSTSNLVDIHCTTVVRRALTVKSKGQRSRLRGY